MSTAARLIDLRYANGRRRVDFVEWFCLLSIPCSWDVVGFVIGR